VTPPEPEPRPSLHYEVPQPLHRRQITTRRVIILIIALSIGGLASQFPRLLRRAQLLYWQHQCLGYSLSPTQMIMSIPAGHSVKPSAVPFIAAPWRELYTLMSRPGMRSDGTVFLHELISPAGHHRLVAVNMSVSLNQSLIECGSRIIKPGDLISEPKEIIAGANMDGFLIAGRAVQIFGGTLDPADPSHFSFAVNDGPDRDQMDGYLRDDDHIRLEFHAIAATQPVPTSPASSP
jgi:hypothetical protein